MPQQQAGESAAGDEEKDKEIAELKEKLQTADDLVETTAQKIQGPCSTENVVDSYLHGHSQLVVFDTPTTPLQLCQNRPE